jgi:hypothetical protein
MNLILEDIELNYSFVDEDSRFDIYLKEKTSSKPIFVAIQNNGKQRYEFELSGNHKLIAKNFRRPILQYRLGKVTDEDEVTLADIFMYGKFNLLVDHNLD